MSGWRRNVVRTKSTAYDILGVAKRHHHRNLKFGPSFGVQVRDATDSARLYIMATGGAGSLGSPAFARGMPIRTQAIMSITKIPVM